MRKFLFALLFAAAALTTVAGTGCKAFHKGDGNCSTCG